MSLSRVSSLFFIFLVFVLFCINYQVVISDPVLKYDDVLMLHPLEKIKALPDYFNFIFDGQITDIQPVRDLSFSLNMAIYNLTGFRLFHFFNLLITALIGLSFFFLLIEQKINKKICVMISLLYISHPVMVSSIGWLSARKHSLSILFIIWALIFFLREKKITLKAGIFYCLSILSHPITLLVPIWMLIYSREKIKKENLFIFLPLIFILALNIYKAFFLDLNNSQFTNIPIIDLASQVILSFGRSLQLIFVPTYQAITYFEGSIMNLIGLALVPFILKIGAMGLKRKNLYAIFLLYLSLWALTAPYFVNDTYLYGPIGVSLALLAKIAQNYFDKHQRLSLGIIFSFFIVCILKSVDYAPAWRSDKDLFLHAYKNEANPEHALYVASNITEKEKLSFYFLNEGFENLVEPREKHFRIGYKTLLKLNKLPVEKKISFIHKFYPDRYLRQSFKGTLYLYSEAFDSLEGLNLISADIELNKELNFLVIDPIRLWCQKNQSTYCRDNGI